VVVTLDALSTEAKNIRKVEGWIMSDKPIGSGYFSLLVGAGMSIFAIVALITRLQIPLDPRLVLNAWILAAGFIMVMWGLGRIWTTTATHDYRVGQSTINMAVALLAVAFTIWAVIAAK